MLDLNHGSGCQYQAPTRDPGITVAVNAAIDAALVVRNQAQVARQYVSTSGIGRECLRQIQYDYLAVPKDDGRDFEPKTLRIFEDMPMTTPAVRPATPDERMRIRHNLDEVFDDSKGMYLDGFSDQRIAEDLKLPRKMIEQIREAAYGPIRTDPEIDQLRTDIATLIAQASTLANRLAEVEKRFQPR